MAIDKKLFGQLDGIDVFAYTLRNASGMQTEILNLGGIVHSLIVPDKMGKLTDVVLGCDNPQDYKASPYFGCIVGRFANRIASGKFTLDGVEYQLALKDGKNHLHGGLEGFDKKIWDAEAADTPDGATLKLTYTSPDGEENYPGTLDCTVIYTLTDNMELKIEYNATTDKPTIVNLTNHSYFNLAGNNADNILDHQIQINSNKVTGIDENLIPTGSIDSITNTPLDLTKATRISDQLKELESGFDHNYIIEDASGKLRLAAVATEPTSGRVMEVLTTEPAVQFYSGNFLNGTCSGKGATYNKHAGLCLEAQHYPDSPNHENFPSVVLRPGQTYNQLTIYKFSVK